MDFTSFSDAELLKQIQNGNEEATEYLLQKYSALVKKCTRTMYIIGSDDEDLMQEGMIGLFKAIQNYQIDNKEGASFYTYAKLCIERQIYSAIKASNRKKHAPLNTYISFYTKINESNIELIDSLEAQSDSNPEHLVLDQENTDSLENILEKHLSSLEKDILKLYLDGNSYASISETTGKSIKSIDNAIQRIRNKVKTLRNDR